MNRSRAHLMTCGTLCLGALWLSAHSLLAADQDPLTAATLAVKQDLEQDTAALTELRAAIAAERLPLAEQLETLRRTVAAQRQAAERVRRLRQQGERDQALMLAQAQRQQEDFLFLRDLFAEYARAMETRAHVAESARLAPTLQPLQAQLAAADAPLGIAEPITALLDLAATWNARRLGGDVFDGAVLDSTGREQRGRVASFGPAAYFAADDGAAAGWVITRFGSDQPTLYDRFDVPLAERLARLLAGEAVTLPVDVTRGDAIKHAQAKTGWLTHIKKGGFVMIPLLAVGALALVLTVLKAIQLSGLRIRADAEVRETLALAQAGDLAAAERRAAALKDPLGGLVAKAIQYRAAPRAHLEELMHEQVLGCLPRLERHLGTLAVLGGVAPLLGLLGTVTGMIHTFQLVTIFGSGDARLLSGGISEALVTTEFGLAIAIPVLLAQAFLARRARDMIGQLEESAVAMVDELTAQAEGV